MTDYSATTCTHPDCDGWMTLHAPRVVEAGHTGTYRAECDCGWSYPTDGASTSRDSAITAARKGHSTDGPTRCDGRCAEWDAA